jgi:asparagine synthase (glutamine-hydrolysing)
MFAFAAAVGFSEGGAAHARRAAAMVGAFPAPPSDGTATRQTAHAAVAVMRWAVVDRDRQVIPFWDDQRQVLVAGDVRLHNRADVAGALDLAGGALAASDLELAGRAYLRWGDEAPRRLVGDFAFVAWDERRRTLLAARDQLGVRPLYYGALDVDGDQGLLVASDVRQILVLTRRPYDDVSAERILERFVPPRRKAGRTYFRGISALRAGHVLVARAGALSERRYWFPPQPPARPASYADSCAELLRLFRGAVRDRLDSEHPIVAHSSGGFDSSTILVTADDLHRSGAARPSIVMASALARGLPCDDSRYMDAVAARVRFEGVRWSALDDDPSPAFEPSLAAPVFRRGMAFGAPRDLELCEQRGARVLLQGTGGDTVLFASGVFLDLFRHGRWPRLLVETIVHRRPLARGARSLVKAALGGLPPAAAAALGARLFGRPGDPPDWLGPELRRIYPPADDAVDPVGRDWPSHTAFDLWRRVNGPLFGAAVGSAVQYAAERGIEARLPFADVRVVEHLLAMPWQQRVPHGQLRRTGRDALGPMLPEELLRRPAQGSWTQVWDLNARRARPTIEALIERGDWLSAPFVDRGRARSMFRQAVGPGPAEPGAWVQLLSFAATEAWLRLLFCYATQHEV